MHLLHINSFSVSSHKNAYIKYLVERDIYEPRDVFVHSCVPSWANALSHSWALHAVDADNKCGSPCLSSFTPLRHMMPQMSVQGSRCGEGLGIDLSKTHKWSVEVAAHETWEDRLLTF